MRHPAFRIASFALALSAVGCADDTDGTSNDSTCVGAKCDAAGDGDADDSDRGGDYCLAIRGNGPLIFSHFGALARIYEMRGLAAGASGGSSGSITSFLVESVHLNPAVTTCGDTECDAAEAGNRAATLWKSMQGYLGVLGQTPEAAALGQLGPLGAKLKATGLETALQGFGELPPEQQAAAVGEIQQALEAVVTSDDVADLIDDELVGLVLGSPNPEFHIPDLAEAIQEMAAFHPQEIEVFLRPGLIDFAKLADKIGRIANFYAGYGAKGPGTAPYDIAGMNEFLDECTHPGAMWSEIATMPAGDSTCGEVFAGLVTEYRAVLAADEDSGDPQIPKRQEEAVGKHFPTLVSTAVLSGTAAQTWDRARADYLAGNPEIDFEIDFTNEVSFGYIGDEDDTQKALRNQEGYEDLKTAKGVALPEMSWRKALSMSPAEPTLTHGVPIREDLISVGGWADGQPTLILHNLGCEDVVYITRKGGTSRFVSQDRRDEDAAPSGVATLLGMDDEEYFGLYDAQTETVEVDGVQRPGAIDLSVREANASWCTNWNEMPTDDIERTVADAYDAVMVSTEPQWTKAYDNHTDEGIPGCSSLTR